MRKFISVDIAPLFNYKNTADGFCFDRHDIVGAKLKGVTFSNGVLDGSTAECLELVDSKFVDLYLGKSELYECYFEDFEFVNCKFVELEFTECLFRNVTFTDCDLFEMTISLSNVEDMQFKNCILKRSSFYKSKVGELTFDSCPVTDPRSFVYVFDDFDETSLAAVREQEFELKIDTRNS